MKHVLWDSTGLGLLEPCAWFPADFTPCALLFADFAWDPFTIIKLALNTLCADLPTWPSGKESTCNAGNVSLIPGLWRSPGTGNGSLTPVFLPGKSHGKREPSRLQSIELQKVRHPLSDLGHTHNMLSPVSLSNKPSKFGVLPGTSDTHWFLSFLRYIDFK